MKPEAQPKNIKQFNLVGPRREAMKKLVKDFEAEGKVELGMSEWFSPAFPVPQKVPGDWRLDIDYR